MAHITNRAIGLLAGTLALPTLTWTKAQEYTFTTLAGPPEIGLAVDGTGSAARFFAPQGVAVDAAGNVYVGDNGTIRKVTPDGTVTTLAGLAGQGGSVDGIGSAARFSSMGIAGVAADSAGNVYVLEQFYSFYSGLPDCLIRKVTPTGVVTTLTPAAAFWQISALAADSAGNLYVADSSTIRKVMPSGAVTTLAGQTSWPGYADGTGSAARFNHPAAVAVDAAGNVYVADNNTIRKVTPGGVVTTLAGLAGDSGYADGTGSAARFSWITGAATDSAGNVYVVDSSTIRKMTPGAVVTTLADATGSAVRFNWATGMAVDSAGNVYVADNNTIWKLAPGGVVTTVAGLVAGYRGNADDTGGAWSSDPGRMAVDSAGNLYVAGVSTIRKVTPDGLVRTLAGLAGESGYADGTGNAARFSWPRGVAADNAGNVYVADNNTIRKVTPGGVVTTLTTLAGHQGGVADVEVDSAGNVYGLGFYNSTIWKLTLDGVVTTLAGLAGQAGTVDGTGSAARFNLPSAMAADGAGNVYVLDSGNSTVRRVTPGGVVTTLAGLPGEWGSADGTGTAARFGNPFDETRRPPAGVTVDSAGHVYVADSANSTIRIGAVACPDTPTVDLPVAPAGLPRQLDTQPQTAVGWQWSWLRHPAASKAELSGTQIRNPSFTPDVPDLYVFRLRATNALGRICIRTLELTAVPTTVPVLTSPERLPGGSIQFTLIGQTNQRYTLQVSTNLSTWTDWTTVSSGSFRTFLTDPAAAQDPHRFYRAR